MKDIISIQNVTFGYEEGKDIIKNLSLNIKEGEYVSVLGHNGSGKSTLVKLINGLLLPRDGAVFVNGLDTKSPENILSIRKTCGMVFQNPDNQLVATSVEEDVAFGLENIGVPQPEMDGLIDKALSAVSMSEFRKREPHNLSGGQKQRIAVAGILAMEPKVILLDEATAMLDPKGRNEVMEIVERLNNRGITIVHVTHHMDQALLSRRCIVVNGGEIVIDDTPINVFKNRRLEELKLKVPEIIKLINGLDIELDEFSYEKVWEAICRLN